MTLQEPLAPPAVRPLNALAVVALVTAFVVPVAGIVSGHLALAQIRRTGERGHGVALAGTVIGYSVVGLAVLLALVPVLFVVVVLGTLTAAAPAMPFPVH